MKPEASTPEIHVMPEKFLSVKMGKRKDVYGLKKNLILGLIIVAVLGGLMATAAYLFTKSFKKTPVNQNVSLPPLVNQNENLNLNKNLNLNINQNVNLNQNINAKPPVSTADWLTYRNEEYGYEVRYPDTWYLYDDDLKNIRVQPEEDQTGLIPGPASQAFEIKVLENTLGISLEERIKEDFGEIKYSTEVITISGVEGLKVDQKEEAIDPTPFIYLPKEDKIYLIKRNLGKMDTFNQILSTFKFIPVTKPPINANINANINAGLPLPSSPDSDNDNLTDLEEALYRTNPNESDTDKDGFIDGDELLSLYDPTKGAGARLEESNLANSYLNSKFNYTILYPSSWTVKSLNTTEEEIIFTSETQEFVEVVVSENLTGLKDAREWYLNQFPTINPSQISDVVVRDLKGIRSLDGFTVYFLEEGSIYTLTYNVGLKESINFKTTFEMMLQSFKVFANPLE